MSLSARRVNSTRQSFSSRFLAALLDFTTFKLADHLLQRNANTVIISQAFVRDLGVLPILDSLKDRIDCDLIGRSTAGLRHVGQKLLGLWRQFDCDHGKLHSPI